MISLSEIKALPKSEMTTLVGPLFKYTLTEAPTQEREALVDKICETLLIDMDEARAT